MIQCMYHTRSDCNLFYTRIISDPITNIAEINVISYNWQSQWITRSECPLFNRFDCRWEEQSLQRTTEKESTLYQWCRVSLLLVQPEHLSSHLFLPNQLSIKWSAYSCLFRYSFFVPFLLLCILGAKNVLVPARHLFLPSGARCFHKGNQIFPRWFWFFHIC